MTFLADWKSYLATRSDSPPAFAIPSGLTMLAVALGNRVYVNGWGGKVYPNIWVVEIAKSGYGKSVPLNVGADVLQQAGLGHLVLPDTFSLEAMIHGFSKQPVGIFLSQEFAAFVDTLGASYNAGAEKWLTSLYDGGENAGKRRLRDANSEDGWKEISIHRPAISMLGASSPDWFAKAFSEAALRGGFFARMIFIPSNTPGPWVGFPGPPDERMMAMLAGHLKQLETMAGEFDVHLIKSALDEWDRQQRHELREETDPEFSGIKSRSGVLVLKIAMLCHVSRDPRTRVITMEDFEAATIFVEGTMRRAMSYLTAQVPRNKPESVRIRIMEILDREPRKLHSELLSELHASSFELKGHIETLMDSEKIRIERDDGRIVYVATRPTTKISTNGNGNHP